MVGEGVVAAWVPAGRSMLTAISRLRTAPSVATVRSAEMVEISVVISRTAAEEDSRATAAAEALVAGVEVVPGVLAETEDSFLM
jgi:hypothetical protein